jgi:hypothetical protein
MSLKNIEVFEALVLGAIVYFFLKHLVYDPFMDYLENNSLIEKTISFFSIIESRLFLVFICVILLIIFISFLYKRIAKRAINKRELKERIEREEERINEILNVKIDYLDSKELKDYIKRLKNISISNFVLEKYKLEIQNKLDSARSFYRIKYEEKKVFQVRAEKRRIEEEIERLKKEKYYEELKNKGNEKIILEKLDAKNNSVYEAESLNCKEINTLKKADFKEINEYDPMYNKYSNFIVKKILNHSYKHTFLVGRLKQFLEMYLDSDCIKIHDTRDADITFKVNSNTYAIEIETGTLLSKKKQLMDKVKYMNNKYGHKNWFFVVSNRDLVKKYKKYGLVIPRVGVCRYLEELLEN